MQLHHVLYKLTRALGSIITVSLLLAACGRSKGDQGHTAGAAQADTWAPVEIDGGNEAGPADTEAERPPGASASGPRSWEEVMPHQPVPQDPARDKAMELDLNRFIAADLHLVGNVRENRYVPVLNAEALDGPVQGSSGGWSYDFFRPAANPTKVVPPSRISVLLSAHDLLRHDYEAEGMRLTVVEDGGFTMIKVVDPKADRLLRLSETERLREVNRVGATLLNVRDPFKPRVPSSPDEAAAFSTGPSKDFMTMMFWHMRVDAGIYKGELYFLCYKRISSVGGFRAGGRWFSDEFRAKHTPAKAPPAGGATGR